MNINEKLISEFSLKPFQIENTVAMIDDGNTIPFISRYRKEATGSLDDQLLREIADRLTYLRNLEKRKDEVRDKPAVKDAETRAGLRSRLAVLRC